MPPLFDKNQQLVGSELVHSISNNAPRSDKYMLISQVFNPETWDLETFVEQCKQDKTTDNVSEAKFSGSDKDSDTKIHWNCSNEFKEHEDKCKKYRKNNCSLYCSLHGENITYISRKCKVLKKRAKDK